MNYYSAVAMWVATRLTAGVLFSGGSRKMQSTDSKRSLRSVLQASAALLIAGITFPVHAALERVGPRDPSPAIGTYPAQYQDKTGLALEFCAPQNQTPIDAGWCNMAVGGTTLPESFPTNSTRGPRYNPANGD